MVFNITFTHNNNLYYLINNIICNKWMLIYSCNPGYTKIEIKIYFKIYFCYKIIIYT